MDIDIETIAFLRNLALDSRREDVEYGFLLCSETGLERAYKCSRVFRGTESTIDIPREIFHKRLIEDKSVVGFAHTHPLGSCFPSEGDLLFQVQTIFMLGSNFLLLTADASENISAVFLASKEPEPQDHICSDEVYPFILKCLDDAGRVRFFSPGTFKVGLLGCWEENRFFDPLDELRDIIDGIVNTYEVDSLTISYEDLINIETDVFNTEWLAFELSGRVGDEIVLDTDGIINVMKNFYEECQGIAMAKNFAKVDNLGFLISLAEVIGVASLIEELSEEPAFFYKLVHYAAYLTDNMFMIMVTRTLNSLLSGVRVDLPWWIYEMFPSARLVVFDLNNPYVPFIWHATLKPIIEYKPEK